MEPVDERAGLPSASNWRRFELCAGSYQLRQEAKRLGQEAFTTSPEATSGERIHAWLAGEKIELGESEQQTAGFLQERAQEQITRIFGDSVTKRIVEKHLWLLAGGVRVASGRADLIVYTKDTALLIDFKAGFREPDPAEQNAQLKVLAVLVALRLPSVKEVICQIVSGPFGVTEKRFDMPALGMAYADIRGTLDRINDPHAAFAPSPEACRYCAALGICQAVKDQVLPVARLQLSALPDGDRAAKLLDECELLERHIKAIREYYSQRLEDPSYRLGGWNLAPGPARREVTNWKAARARLEEFVSAADIDGLANYSIPSLETLLAKTLKIRAKDAKEKLGAILGELLNVKPGNPILKRVKGEPKLASLELS